jgi:hypothetical protein
MKNQDLSKRVKELEGIIIEKNHALQAMKKLFNEEKQNKIFWQKETEYQKKEAKYWSEVFKSTFKTSEDLEKHIKAQNFQETKNKPLKVVR